MLQKLLARLAIFNAWRGGSRSPQKEHSVEHRDTYEPTNHLAQPQLPRDVQRKILDPVSTPELIKINRVSRELHAEFIERRDSIFQRLDEFSPGSYTGSAGERRNATVNEKRKAAYNYLKNKPSLNAEARFYEGMGYLESYWGQVDDWKAAREKFGWDPAWDAMSFESLTSGQFKASAPPEFDDRTCFPPG